MQSLQARAMGVATLSVSEVVMKYVIGWRLKKKEHPEDAEQGFVMNNDVWVGGIMKFDDRTTAEETMKWHQERNPDHEFHIEPASL